MRQKGYKLTDEHRFRISLALRGRKLSEENKRNIGLSNKGFHPVTEFKVGHQQHSGIEKGWFKKGQTSPMKGKTTSEASKEKMRISRINYIKKIGGVPQVGKIEKAILDRIESKFGLRILRQYPVKGYLIDGYIPELKIAIEIDEEYHNNTVEKDLKRQRIIEQALGCIFLRYRINKCKFNFN